MRTENIAVKMTIPIPFDKPDGNMIVHTEEAVEKALNCLPKNLPILYRGTEMEDAKCIGSTTGNYHIVTWDFENQICKVTVDGVIFHGGADIIVNEMKNGEISDFTITSCGISL